MLLASLPFSDLLPPLIFLLTTISRTLRSAPLFSEGTLGSATNTNNSGKNLSILSHSRLCTRFFLKCGRHIFINSSSNSRCWLTLFLCSSTNLCFPFGPYFDLSSLALGQQRFGISVQAEVVLLRQQCRLPFRVIQNYLKHRFNLRVSVGQLVALVDGVASRGKAVVEELKQQIRGSPVVNGDETTWRENGQNRYVWSFSTDKISYFVYEKSRAGRVVKEVLGEKFDGVVVSDFYGGYNCHLGLHQRCWVHLLRDIHELKEKQTKDQGLRKWAAKVKAIYERAKGYTGFQRFWHSGQERSTRRCSTT